jgi:hypothetical protein
MNPQLSNAMASSHIDDLRRSADAARAAAGLRGPSRSGQLARALLNLRLRERPPAGAAAARSRIVEA